MNRCSICHKPLVNDVPEGAEGFHVECGRALAVAAHDSSHKLCPVCGELIHLRDDLTKDGRLIGSCGDAFTVAQWEA